MAEDERDYVAEALEILRAEGFPVDRIRVLPAARGASPAATGSGIDRDALLAACCEVLEDGVPRSAKEFALDLRKTFPGLTRKEVSSVLSREGGIVSSTIARSTPTPWRRSGDRVLSAGGGVLRLPRRHPGRCPIGMATSTDVPGSK